MYIRQQRNRTNDFPDREIQSVNALGGRANIVETDGSYEVLILDLGLILTVGYGSQLFVSQPLFGLLTGLRNFNPRMYRQRECQTTYKINRVDGMDFCDAVTTNTYITNIEPTDDQLNFEL